MPTEAGQARASTAGRHEPIRRQRDRVQDPVLDGFQLTDRDRTIARFIALHRMVTSAQIGRRMGITIPGTVQRRLRALREAGFVQRVSPFIEGQSPVYLVTRKGLRWLGLALPPPSASLATWVHDLAVVDLAVSLELAGSSVVTERQMRSSDARGEADPKWGVSLSAVGRPRTRWHFPDLVSDLTTAWEIERAPKTSVRLEKIVEGYRWSRRYAKVVYLVESRPIHNLLTKLTEVPALPERLGPAGSGTAFEIRGWPEP